MSLFMGIMGYLVICLVGGVAFFGVMMTLTECLRALFSGDPHWVNRKSCFLASFIALGVCLLILSALGAIVITVGGA